MKQLTILLLLVWGVALDAQTLNQQLTDQSIIVMKGNGREIKFAVAEAKMLYAMLWRQTDPVLVENRYFPFALSQQLRRLRKDVYVLADPNFPQSWGSQVTFPISAPAAQSDYCVIPNTPIQHKPCVQVFVTVLMISMQLEHGLTQANEMVRNEFAIMMGHEAIHLELDEPQMRAVQASQAKMDREEIRAWYRTIRDFAQPLRQSNHPISPFYSRLVDILQACNMKLPCKEFEAKARSYASKVR